MKRTLVNVMLWGGLAVMLLPVGWVLLASFRVGVAVFDGGPLTLANYAQVLRSPLLVRQIGNGLLIAGGGTAFGYVVCSLAGFTLAKLKFIGRSAFTALCVAVLLLPSLALLPAVFRVVTALHLFDTRVAIVLPHAAAAFGALLFRQAFESVPDETLDAARIDGCGAWRLWWTIALPQVKPMAALFTLLSFLALWGGYLWPQVVLTSVDKQPLAVALADLAASAQAQQNYGVLMAATVIGLIPPAVVFIVCARAWDRGSA